MVLLIAGVAIFAVVHLFPAAVKTTRDNLAARLGNNPYRGLFSLLILGSIALMVAGWKSATPTLVYLPPLRPGIVTSALILIAFILFVASARPTNLRRVIRHPQMTGVIAWSIGHLLANGDSRSVVLFGGLGLWAIAEILLCNKRDGAWTRPQPVGLRADAIVAVIGLIAFAVIAYSHRWLFGVSVAPGL